MFCYFIDADSVISAPIFEYEMPSRQNSRQSNTATMYGYAVQDVDFTDLGEVTDLEPVEAVVLQ